MGIEKELKQISNEVRRVKNERDALFLNFEANKDRISELHFEIEIKQLQYLFLKRKQLSDLKLSAIDVNSIVGIEKVNDTCIQLAQEKLVDNGYLERLVQEGLV